MPFMCTIAGVDVSANFKGMEVNPTGDRMIGSGTLFLDQQAGGMTILDMMPVNVWKTFNAAGAGIAPGGRLFQGVIKVRDTGTEGTTKTWGLECWDNNVILQMVVRDAQSAKQVHLTAGTFAAQVIQLFQIIQRNGAGAVNTEVDATTGVVDFYATMPDVIYEGGHEVGWYVQQLCLTARGKTSTGGAISGTPTITSGGSGYTTAPTVTVAPPPAGGTQAVITCTILAGVVNSLTVVNAGRGYPSAPAITFTGGEGSGAAASATVTSVVYAILPAYYMGVGATFGAAEVFGPPVLYIYDSLVSPAIGTSFSDVIAGGRKGIFGKFRRVTDASAPMVQRRQSIFPAAGTVVTSQNATSQATYPNPYINHGGASNTGYWMLPALEDTTSTSVAEAQAALDRQIAVLAFPRDTFTFDTEERIMPGNTIGLGYSLEGIADDTPYRVAAVRMHIEPPDTVLSSLVVNSRRLGMFDDGSEGVLAPPAEGDPVPPLPPASFVLSSNYYDGDTGDANLLFTIGASPSPDAVGYRIIGRVGHAHVDVDVETTLTPALIFPSGLPYSFQAVAYDRADNRSEPFPAVALIGTTAVPVYDKVPNPDFDTFDRLDSTLPYHWTRSVANGGTATYNTASNTGPACCKLSTTATGGSTASIISSMTVVKGPVYGEVFWAKASAGTPSLTVAYDWYDNTQVFLSTTSFAKTLTTSWVRYTGTMTRPANGAFFKVRYVSSASNVDIRVDTTSHDPQAPADAIEDGAITPAKTYFLATGGSPVNYYDTNGALAHKVFESGTVNAAVLNINADTGGNSQGGIKLTHGNSDTVMLLEQTTGNMSLAAGSTNVVINHSGTIDVTGNTGIAGNTHLGSTGAATAVAHIIAGTATANTAPLKFTSGTNLTTPEAGAVEYNGTSLFFTPGTVRQTVVLSGTAFPTSPSSGQGFFRTDLNVLCVYDGTRWLGPSETWRLYDPNSLTPTGITTNQTPWLRKMPQSKFSYYVDRITWQVRVDTTSSISHYWTLRFGHESNTLGGAVDCDVTTATLSAGANDWVEGTSFSTNPLDFTTAGVYTMFLELVKTGSPGQLNIWAVDLSVRRVYT